MTRRRAPRDFGRLPLPGTNVPGSVAFTPDGGALTYLYSADDSLVRSLWRHDLVTGERRELASPLPETTSEAAIEREEQLRRERSGTSELGVTSYAWASAAREATLLVPMAGRLFVGIGDESVRGVHPIPGVAEASGARLSPDGRLISYTSGGNLHVVGVHGGAPTRLTDDGGPGVANGVPDFIAAEELDRLRGAWWSSDSRSIAFARVDDRVVPAVDIVPAGVDHAAELHRYPFAGGPNAEVSLHVAGLGGADPAAVRLEMAADDYLARVLTHPAGGWLVATLPRDQRSLTWHRVAADGSARILWREEADPWINLDDDTRILSDGRILRSSERGGFRHLELRRAEGDVERVLTRGEWVVTGVAGLADARGEVLFTATRDGVLERHLYAIPLDAAEPVSDPERLTAEAGWHDVVASRDGQRWIETWSDLETAPRVVVTGRDEPSVTIHAPSATAESLTLDPPELLDLVAADGHTTLHAALYRAGGQPAPAQPAAGVVWVYGGPHSQYVKRAWEMTVSPLRQLLARSGAAVVVVDNRGTANRGVAFEAILDRWLGKAEVADQAAAVRQLAARGELDIGRVGITGGSYGGFMTLMAMAGAPDLFRVGVAIAPVTDWALYDTAYTERYLGLPSANPAGYRGSSPTAWVAALTGDMLLMHGTRDDNVHFEHSRRVAAALATVGHDVELLRLPGQRHRVRGDEAIRLREERTATFLLRGLGLAGEAELG